MATNYGPSVDYAGFWARLAAYIVDCAILWFLLIAISAGASFVDGSYIILGQLIWFVISLLYWPVMESSASQATLGKRIIGIEVTDLNGKRMSFLHALLRNLAKIISSIPLCIGYLLAAFTPRKQALHDMLTKSMVVRTRSIPLFKGFAAALAWIFLAVGGSGAYLYYLLLPQMPELQAQLGMEMQQPMAPPAKPAPPPVAQTVSPASAVAVAPNMDAASAEPASGVVAAVPVTSVSAPLPKEAVAAAPEPVIEPAPIPAKPARSTRKSASKKPVKKVVVEAMPEPEPVMDSQSIAPEPSPEISQQAPVELPKPLPIVKFVPDTESRVIKPKYNDVMTAVLRNDMDGLKQLLDLGWWVDKPGSDGITPLMAAVMNQNPEMVKVLLDHGAVPTSQALKLAREKKDAASASLLEQWGAR